MITASLETMSRPREPRLAPTPRQAKAEWIRAHHPRVWRFLRHLGCDAHSAEDLAQETFLIALRDRFDPRTAAEDASLLQGIARNLYRNFARKRGRRSEEEWIEAVDRDWLDPSLEGDERLDALQDCVERLPARMRLGVRLRYFEEQPAEAIRRELGMRESGLKTLLLRARRALADCVEQRTRTEHQNRGDLQ